MSKIKIFLADDHETVRDGLKLVIEAQPDMEVVGVAGDGRMAVEQAQKLKPDLVVMDVSMPQMNGLNATWRLKQVAPDIKVLALTRHTDDGYLQQLLQAGASGYVLKQSASAELLHAIRSIIAGGNYLDPAIAGKLMGNYIKRGRKRNLEPQTDLSNREEEVMRLIAWGYSNKEVAAQLDISVKTVETHKANSMRKLGMSGRVDIVRYALLKGWLQDT